MHALILGLAFGLNPQVTFDAAESLRREGKYPQAAELYRWVLMDGGEYRPMAAKRLFDIADYWLDDTRSQLQLRKDWPESWRWSWVFHVVHLDPHKPLFNEEGQAVRILDEIASLDPDGKYATKALFIAGSVHFYREDYRGAAWRLGRLVNDYPDSPYVPTALELAVISNAMSGNRLEARRLIDKARMKYPSVWKEKERFFLNQLRTVSIREAE